MSTEQQPAAALLRAWSQGESSLVGESVPADTVLAAALEQLAAASSAPDAMTMASVDRCLQLQLLRLLPVSGPAPPWSASLAGLIQRHRHLLAVQTERFDRRWSFLLDVLALRSASVVSPTEPVHATAQSPLLIADLSEGAVYRGVVRNVFDSGAFLDLGGVTGLLHLSDMAWQRLGHPSELLKVGDMLDVRVLAVDRARERVSLGLKQLGPDPWTAIERRLVPGTRRFGRVSFIDKHGCMVGLEPGVDGLVHVSEMDELQRQSLTLGAEVEVRVLRIDSEQRRISLSMLPEVTADPWTDFARLHAPGDVMTGEVIAITEHGMFLRLAEGVDGFLHHSDLPAAIQSDGTDWRQPFKRGMRMQVLIRQIDSVQQRVSLGAVPPPSTRVDA